MLNGPPHMDQDHLDLSLAFPTTHSLEAYMTNMHYDTSKCIAHFDFWIFTSCADVTQILPKYGKKTREMVPNKYLTNLAHAIMSVSKQEQFLAGRELCAVLVGSVIRDKTLDFSKSPQK
jgi:hypothetical protein